MGKGSFIKITISLVIALGYICLFGSTEKIESINSSRIVGQDNSHDGQVENPDGGEKESDGDNTGTAEETSAEESSETSSPNAGPFEITFPDYTGLDVSNQVRPFELNGAATLPAGYEEAPVSAVSSAEEEETTTTAKDFVETSTEERTESDSEETSSETAEITSEQESSESERETPQASEPDVSFETTSSDIFIIEEDTTTDTEAASETSEEVSETPEDTTIAPPRMNAGELTVRYTGSGGSVTGDAAEILAQVVMGEIGGGFNEEAIKAQAVAAYTYIKYYNNSGNVPYVAVRTPSDKVKSCVNEVLGEAIYYDGALIQAVYGASTAGYTASAKNVWGIDYPYLPSQKCELDSLYDPNYGVKTTFTSEEIRTTVRNATGIDLSGDPGTWFAIKGYVDNVYVGEFSIGGRTEYVNNSGKTVNITGRVMREQIMDYNLRSACFEVSYSADTDKFTFTTYGYGHGVGLSQHGANNLANYWDYNYREILDYYYPGTVIQ